MPTAGWKRRPTRRPSISYSRSFRDSGFHFKELLIGLVRSEEFLRGLDDNDTKRSVSEEVRMRLSRRRFLRGLSLTGAAVRVGLPPLAAMFNSNGTAYAAPGKVAGGGADRKRASSSGSTATAFRSDTGFPRETGPDYELTPCLAPLKSVREYVHVISGIDNVAARLNGQGNGHFSALCGLMTGTPYTGRGAAGPSIDHLLAAKIGAKSRFHSLQIGVAQESHGENVHRNMSWAGYERALPPEMIPHNLFDRLFGVKNESWVNRKKSVLDLVLDDVNDLTPALGQADRQRLDEHLTSVRDLERAISSLPPDYGKNIKEPEDITDLTDYPRIAKIQSDLLIHAFASGQTRVASYMLTKCQSLTRFPWLGLAGNRHHDYTHNNAGIAGAASASCAISAAGTWRSSRTCWSG